MEASPNREDAKIILKFVATIVGTKILMFFTLRQIAKQFATDA